ncbi:hypothetical protein TB2_022567 [Malus domestica]
MKGGAATGGSPSFNNNNITTTSDQTTTSTSSWGTWEELLLACAVKRYGIHDRDTVAMELQAKISLSPSTETCFSSSTMPSSSSPNPPSSQGLLTNSAASS